jgi:hypothetical protein
MQRPFAQQYPRTDGVNGVWEDTGDAVAAHWDIVGADVVNGPAYGWVFPVAVGGNTKRSPDIDGDFVVWVDRGCIYLGCKDDSNILGMNLRTGAPFTVADTELDESTPAVSGDWVVWFADDDSYLTSKTLLARNLRTMDPPIVLAEDIGFRAIAPAIDGNRVVWVDTASQLYGGDELWTMRIGVDPAPVLVRSDAVIADASLDVAGDVIVYIEHGDVVAQDVGSGTLRTLATYAEGEYDYGSDFQHATTDGRYVCWTNNHDWEHGGNALECYDLQTDSRFVAYSGGYSWDAHVADGLLVWSHWDTIVDDQASDSDIFVARVAALLPSAPLAASDVTDPTRAYVPETGHTFGVFHDYWTANGGVPVFGYPLTEEFLHVEPSTGDGRAVQFTERQRFEAHPEHADTPYAVLLGRLGAELLTRQGRDWSSFPTVDPASAHYTPVTGHAIAPEFWEYWSGHGLEFGDPGVSERESLALFGYPLSEPMLETNVDGDMVLTQYFERAVFEYHPENAGTPYVVLLRRLGAEALTARGW